MPDVHAVAPTVLKLVVAWIGGGFNSTAHVYEDGGGDLKYQQGMPFYALTNLSASSTTIATALTIEGAATAELPQQRQFEVRFKYVPSTVTNGSFSGVGAVGSSWHLEEDAFGVKTLVGITKLVPSTATITASFAH